MGNKPWVVYKNAADIKDAISEQLHNKFGVANTVVVNGNELVCLLVFNGNVVKISVTLNDLKAQYDSVEAFVSFLYECYKEAVAGND